MATDLPLPLITLHILADAGAYPIGWYYQWLVGGVPDGPYVGPFITEALALEHGHKATMSVAKPSEYIQ
jgi:hypothetical protein